MLGTHLQRFVCVFYAEWISNLIRDKKNSNQGVHGRTTCKLAFKQNIE